MGRRFGQNPLPASGSRTQLAFCQGRFLLIFLRRRGLFSMGDGRSRKDAFRK